MAQTYTSINGAMRIYDGSGTPYYIQVLFDQGDLSAPEGRARPEEKLILHRGTGDANAHYVVGNDEPVCEPLDLSFSFRLQADTTAHDKLRNALCNPSLAATWTVGTDTWVSTKGDSTLVNNAGTNFTDPAFADPKKVTVNVEILWTAGGVSIGRQFKGVYFPPDQMSFAESEDGVIVSVTGKVYGEVNAITSFTTGTES